ncbi:MAG: GNAT family N-acetyltransferase [Gammaproteobacteria bacterium]|jgi:RimJ/RimL family protein N-acetyltransferase
MNKKIETERLIIRPYECRDLDDVYEQFKNAAATKYISGVKTYEETKKYLEDKITYLEQNFPLGRRAVVLKKSNKVIGYCGLEPILVESEYLIELSYGLNCEYWGYGYAFEAAKAMLDYGFEIAKFTEIFSAINPKNIGSIKIAKKLGLQYQKDIDWPNQGKVNLFMIRFGESY